MQHMMKIKGLMIKARKTGTTNQPKPPILKYFGTKFLNINDSRNYFIPTEFK